MSIMHIKNEGLDARLSSVAVRAVSPIGLQAKVRGLHVVPLEAVAGAGLLSATLLHAR